MALFCSRPGHRSKAAPVYSSSDSEEDYDKDMAWAYESLKMKQGLRTTSVFYLDMIPALMATFQGYLIFNRLRDLSHGSTILYAKLSFHDGL